jgi:hypothetical protein
MVRRFVATLAAAAVLSAPWAALAPSEALAQQTGLVNVSVDNNDICVACDVTVAAQAIVQACDLIDVNQAQVLVVQVLTTNVPVQESDCSQRAGDQRLEIRQATTQG